MKDYKQGNQPPSGPNFQEHNQRNNQQNILNNQQRPQTYSEDKVINQNYYNQQMKSSQQGFTYDKKRMQNQNRSQQALLPSQSNKFRQTNDTFSQSQKHDLQPKQFRQNNDDNANARYPIQKNIQQNDIKDEKCMGPCGKKFGYIFKGKQCQQCLSSFCGNCSNDYDTLQGKILVKKRLCKKCHIELDKLNEQILNLKAREKDSDIFQTQQADQLNAKAKEQKVKNKDKNLQNQKEKEQQIEDLKYEIKMNGLKGGEELMARQSQMLVKKIQHLHEQELNEYQQNRSMSRKSITSAPNHQNIGLSQNSIDDMEFDNNLQKSERQFDQNQELMEQIQNKVLNMFNIDVQKWSPILQDFVKQAISKVKPQSNLMNDSINITNYVKIQLIKYKDTSKCKYVNGVVIKKGLSRKGMLREIDNPRIIIVANSLGYMKEEEDFIDIEQQVKQEDDYLNRTIQKILSFMPSLIIVQESIHENVREVLFDNKISCISNVKKSLIEKIERLTSTPALQNINLLSQNFHSGKCEKFYVESLKNISLNTNQDPDTDITFLDGCSPFLGCTILLSSDNLIELKIVKHALKKILLFSRQLNLEYEYYQDMKLDFIDKQDQINYNKEFLNQSIFLHDKHMERDFLIFKEVSFSKRGIKNRWEDEQVDDKDDQIKNDQVYAQHQTEKEIQAKIQRICEPPQMKKIKFYIDDSSDKHQSNDISLGQKIRHHFKSQKKCSNESCGQNEIFHAYHFYHKDGYVEMKMRQEKDPNDPYEFKNKDKAPISIIVQCEECKCILLKVGAMSRQTEEFSFYSFLEQFFYNQNNLKVQNQDDQNQCTHSFHKDCRIIFQIDKFRVEFKYYPVDIYSLDLICFKDHHGSLSEDKIKNNFSQAKLSLQRGFEETQKFVLHSIIDLNAWLRNIDYSKVENQHILVSKNIIESMNQYLQVFQQNVIDYNKNANEALESFKANHEFYLNKIHYFIANRYLDYLYILLVLHNQVQEFIQNIQQKNKEKKGNQKKDTNQNNQANNKIGQFDQKQKPRQNLTFDGSQQNVVLQTKQFQNIDSDTFQFINQTTLENTQTEIETQNEIESIMLTQSMQKQRSFTNLKQKHEYESNENQIFEFENRLKENKLIKKFMSISPSIPCGFDLNCTNVDQNDLSTIICQALLSNEHIIGLKEQGYMDIDSRLDKQKHLSKINPAQSSLKNTLIVQSNRQFESEYDKINAHELNQIPDKRIQTMNFKIQEDFLVFKEKQDILNKEISLKEIETELLRLEQFNFQINFNNYKGPQSSELLLIKDGQKNIKCEKKILSSLQTLQPLEKIYHSDIDQQFYLELNKDIIKKIQNLKNQRDLNKNNQNENQQKEITQDQKYMVTTIFKEDNGKEIGKIDIGVMIYFPSHFQALRKLYCGSLNQQSEQLFKSSQWADNTGGKSKSMFYKSYSDKYVMKVINSGEMNKFNEFALSYFEYMCRSFNQKCPTSIGKILGAFKISIKQDKKSQSYYVIMMENLTIGIDPKSKHLSKYDLKGSMSRRYVDTKGKSDTTKLDTNFLEDFKSKPICMNYTMNRLMEIAIHNDTSFLHRYDKIDYSFLVWIDHERKLIRVGIIDYIQNYSFDKQLESKIKQAFSTQGNAPTILNATSYKERFKKAMGTYFISILEDKPCETFDVIIKRQIKQNQSIQNQVLQNKLDIDQIQS